MTDNQTRTFPFPEGAEDQDVFFHGELVCEYHANTNTWECWRHSREERTNDT